MFTGIVQAVGQIQTVSSIAAAQSAWGEPGVRLRVGFGDLDSSDIAIGDSIAINGACMTVVEKSADAFQVDVSRESLNRTTRLDCQGPVNLEKAMRANDRLGGHMVSGHIDGTGVIQAIEPAGESWRLVVRLPNAMSAYVTEKGSIALDGVSLTINEVSDTVSGTVPGTDISVNLIPHTWQATTLQLRKPGEAINVELDQLAKQVARIVERLALKK
jgi:riboflavin synthase